MPPPFDKFVKMVMDAACPEWDAILKSLFSQPTVMMTLRWHYETSSIVRQGCNMYLKSITGIVSTPPSDCASAQSTLAFMKDIFGQFATYEERTKNTDLYDACASSRELLSDPRMVEGLASMSASSSELDKMVRGCIVACCNKFTKKKLIVVAKM